MKQTVIVKGMKCEGCKNNVQTSLSSIEKVDQVLVDLDEQLAYVDSSNGIAKEEAQEALAATAYQVVAIQ